MDSQYGLINECLQLVRQCNVASIKKLRLEVQLFRIKLLLLSDSVSGDIKGKFCSETVLQEMHHEMLRFGDGEDTGTAIEAVSQRLKQIESDLARQAAAP